MKTITISPSSTLRSVQDAFEKQYPYLKIEFFKGEHEVGELSVDRKKVDTRVSFEEVTKISSDLVLNISPEVTVAELEQSFKVLPDLSIQVYRKSGRVYIETSVTDAWTLKEQNTKGFEMTEPSVN